MYFADLYFAKRPHQLGGDGSTGSMAVRVRQFWRMRHVASYFNAERDFAGHSSGLSILFRDA